MTSTDQVKRLAAMIGEVLPPLADCRDGYALLDFPNYSNVGDSLIWLGEMAYFEHHVGASPGYVSTTSGFDADRLRKAVPEGPIFLSGGGNFGDLWPRFQEFRYKVLAAFPDRRIVQLPQTLHFDSEDAIRQTATAIAKHGKFSLLVRDQKSLAFAQANFACDAHLCPDMAFCMGAQAAAAPECDVLALLRNDKERAEHPAYKMAPYGSIEQTDWLRPGVSPSVAQRAANKLARILKPSGDYDRFAAIARSERARGIAILSRGRVVVTDRLHGHILSVLLGRPHVVIDNRHGKISGFMAAWTGDTETVRVAAHPTEAFRIAKEMARDLG